MPASLISRFGRMRMAVAAALLLGLAACAAPFNANVSRFQSQLPAPAGQTFAVVADEVRKLAERSSLAAKEITQLIKESTRRVAEGAELSEKVGNSLSSIVQAVEQSATGIARIAESTETQAESAKEVQLAIRSVGKTTESNAAGAEEMAQKVAEMLPGFSPALPNKRLFDINTSAAAFMRLFD